MTQPLLAMRGIEKRFSGVPALSSASLEVEPGEVMALIGQNGAGKSTMIKILNGAYRKDAGEIAFDGRPVEFASPHEAQQGGISTIFQEINLVPYRSVAENIFMGREPRRLGLLDWRRIHRESEELLRRFRIEIDVRRPLMGFNTAVQQMVAIARAIGFRAKLVIMDEPTSSLHDQEVEVLFDVIRQLRAEGVSVIFVSHKLDELYAVCDRVTIMRDGRTVHVSRMADITKLELVATMLGRDLATVSRQGATGFGASWPSAAARATRASPSVRARSWASRACWAPAAPRSPAPSSASTRPTPARSAWRVARSASGSPARPSPPASASAPRTARSRASCPRCRCART
jgi:galactofuranose transport system ATP-binding protein